MQVWNGGQGGQCPMMPSASGFGLCKTHAERHAAEGLAHGRVDGTIPLDAWTILDRGVDETSNFLPKFMVTSDVNYIGRSDCSLVIKDYTDCSRMFKMCLRP